MRHLSMQVEHLVVFIFDEHVEHGVYMWDCVAQTQRGNEGSPNISALRRQLELSWHAAIFWLICFLSYL